MSFYNRIRGAVKGIFEYFFNFFLNRPYYNKRW
jgi:hypothetical protein